MSTKNMPRLGRGLSSLVSTDIAHTQETQRLPGSSPVQTMDGLRGVAPPQRLMMISVDRIRQNPLQPRREFNEEALGRLAESLKDRGTLQPVVVRPSEGNFELIAGERRLRAAKIAGIHEIPAVVRSVNDDEMLELALIENIQRADLNPIERARAYQSIQQRTGLSHEEIAARVGDERVTVTNYIRLLSLPESVVQMVSKGEISGGHAKALLGVTNSLILEQLAARIVQEGWSVRRIEEAVAKTKPPAADQPVARPARPVVTDMEQKLGAAVGTRVTIREGRRRHSGRIVVEYYTLDDFERIAGLLGVKLETY